MRSPAERTGIIDALLVWAILAVVALEMLATYTRTPVQELYHVRTGGIAEGAGRALASLGFPVGLAALALLPVVVDRARRRHVALGAAAGAALAVAVLWPGALDEAGVGATPARILAAVGMLLSLALTFAAWHAWGVGPFGREHGDVARIAIGVALLLVALPWIAADLGLSFDRVPLLRTAFLTDQLASQPSRPGVYPAVHDGHHHGMDGVLLAWTALIVSRTIRHLRHRSARTGLAVYVGFLFVYGVANAVQDASTEQIVKRGWTGYEIPSVLFPSADIAWLVIVGLSVVAAVLLVVNARPTVLLGRPLGDRP